MRSLIKVMTPKEATCFRTLQHYKKKHILHQLRGSLVPRPPYAKLWRESLGVTRFMLALAYLLGAPLWLFIWLLKAGFALVSAPLRILLCYQKPADLRAPGQRNIQGVHYQFAQHNTLSPRLYLSCIDEWIATLYGEDKLPEYSIYNYLDAHYFERCKVAYSEDRAITELLESQINHAREDLSKKLGHY